MAMEWQPSPRALTAAERRLLDHLVAFADSPELTAQAAAASVSAVCSCGCSSVQLTSDGPDVPAATIARLSPYERDDYVGIGVARPDDHATSGFVHILQVVVHVGGGRLLELEIYHGQGEAVPVPDPASLPDIQVI